MPLVQHRGSTRGQEGRLVHAEEAEDRLQIRLNKVERCHLRLSIVNAAGRNDESCLLARHLTAFPLRRWLARLAMVKPIFLSATVQP
jgi:hypothetical protein